MDALIWVGIQSDFLGRRILRSVGGSLALCKEILGWNVDILGKSMVLDDYNR